MAHSYVGPDGENPGGPWVDVTVGNHVRFVWSSLFFGLLAAGLAAFHFAHPGGSVLVGCIYVAAAGVGVGGAALLWWMSRKNYRGVRVVPGGLLVRDREGRRLVADGDVREATVGRMAFQSRGAVATIVLAVRGAFTGLPVGQEPWTACAGSLIVRGEGGESALPLSYAFRTAGGDPLESFWDRLGDRVTVAGG